MMMKRKSNPWARCKYLYVLPLAVIAVTAFARPEVQEASSAISEVKVNDLIGNMVTNQEENSVSSLKTLEVPQQAVPQDPVRRGSEKIGNHEYTYIETSQGRLYEIIEEPCRFPGGEAALLKFISDNIKYPEAAYKAGVSGRVTTRFVINEDGSVSNVEIVRTASEMLNDEAIRVVSSMPKWSPGKVGGRAVKVRFTLPITFRLQGANVQSTPVPNTAAKDGIYEIVDEMPLFPGGDAAMMKYLSENIKYPEEAIKAGASGRVFTQFVVNEDGSVSDVKLLRGVHQSLDVEAIRVVNAMPKWTPAKVGGKAVKCRYALPIVFNLQ